MSYLFWEKDEERSCVESRNREFETKDDGIVEGMPIDQMVRGVLEDYNLMRGREDVEAKLRTQHHWETTSVPGQPGTARWTTRHSLLNGWVSCAWVGSVKCELLSGKIIPASFIPRRA